MSHRYSKHQRGPVRTDTYKKKLRKICLFLCLFGKSPYFNFALRREIQKEFSFLREASEDSCNVGIMECPKFAVKEQLMGHNAATPSHFSIRHEASFAFPPVYEANLLPG